MNCGGIRGLALEDESESVSESVSTRDNAMVIILFIAGIFAPYAANINVVSVLLFPLFWLYWPPVVIESGLFILYSLMYGLPGYIQFAVFIYTIVGRLLYPYQMRRYLHGKSTITTTIGIGLLIELPLFLSVALAFSVIPLPICTLVAIILIQARKK